MSAAYLSIITRNLWGIEEGMGRSDEGRGRVMSEESKEVRRLVRGLLFRDVIVYYSLVKTT